jgi:predicted RNase H-like HicB family nuclease
VVEVTVPESAYLVEVTREGGKWLADVPGLDGGHTFADTLASLDQSVREVISLVEDLPDSVEHTLVLNYRFVDVPLADLEAERERLRQAVATAGVVMMHLDSALAAAAGTKARPTRFGRPGDGRGGDLGRGPAGGRRTA